LKIIIPDEEPPSVKSTMLLDRDVAVLIRKLARHQHKQLSDFLMDMIRVYAREKNWKLESEE
jgi:uncharacterized protein (DUF1778 family)